MGNINKTPSMRGKFIDAKSAMFAEGSKMASKNASGTSFSGKDGKTGESIARKKKKKVGLDPDKYKYDKTAENVLSNRNSGGSEKFKKLG
jgi:hypothetical protein